jgi:hypothetical protein
MTYHLDLTGDELVTLQQAVSRRVGDLCFDGGIDGDEIKPFNHMQKRLLDAMIAPLLDIEPERHQTVGISAIAFGPLK